MAQRKDRPTPVKPRDSREPGQKPEAAFDLWLNRGLHQLFDDVAREPIPEELLRIIEEDRNR
ncbi:MAG TPA: hypothetical protein VJY39_04275 [Acidisphaera sp.]|nr:hypothetical protein [Acidisphaera sp.]